MNAKKFELTMKCKITIMSILAVWIGICVILMDLYVEIEVPSYQVVEYGDEVSFDAAAYFADKSFDIRFKDLEVVVVANSDFDVGTHIVEYTARYGIWQTTTSQKVVVKDTIPPEIILVTNEDSYTLPGHVYEEEGFVATDNHDGDITDKVKRIEFNGVVRYDVTDESGNMTTVQREIVYGDPIAPVITLKGDTEMMCKLGEDYVEPGFEAMDNVDGDITSLVVINSNVDTSKMGSYEITYSVTDYWNNTTSIVRTVLVSDGRAELTEELLGVPEHKVIYLTFDDGPGPYTEKLLDILDKYDVKATFFVTNQYPEYRYLIKEEYDRGHTVGIHSLTHDYAYIYSSEENYIIDLEQMHNIIKQETGSYTHIVRFPGGSSNTVSIRYNKGIMSKLSAALSRNQYVYFDWNVSSGDAGETTNTSQIVENIIEGCEKNDKSIVLQHDTNDFSIEAVEEVIKWGKENGYTFLPLYIDSFDAHHGFNN